MEPQESTSTGREGAPVTSSHVQGKQPGDPAERLLHAVEAAARAGEQTPTAAGYNIWSSVFNISENDIQSFTKSYSRLVSLPAAVRAALQRTGRVNLDFIDEHLRRVESALTFDALKAPWKQSANNFDDRTAIALRAASAIILDNAAIHLGSDDLKNLQDEVNDLRDDVDMADIPEDLRQFLLDAIQDLSDALRFYWISGSSGLVSAVDRATGGLVRTIASDSATARDSRVSRLTKVLSTIVVALSLANQGYQLEQNISGLPHNPAAIEQGSQDQESTAS